MEFSEKDLMRIRVLYDELNSKHWVTRAKSSPDYLNVKARNIGNAIYDIKAIWTWYMSKTALEMYAEGKVTAKDLCYEHFHSRQHAGMFLADLFIDRDVSWEDFLPLITKFCCAHRVLSKENTKLVKYQNQGLPWIECYELADIHLVRVDMTDRQQLRPSLAQQFVGTPATPLDLVEHSVYERLGI